MKKTPRLFAFILIFIIHYFQIRRLIWISILSTLFTTHCEAQWFKLPNLPDSGGVYKIQFVNPNTGWLSTNTFYLPNYFTFMKTTNGGVSWTRIQNTGQVLIFYFFNDSLGIAIDKNGANVSKSTNGGLNWNTIYTTSNGYGDMFFVNKDTGWTCGGDGNLAGVWRTTDGGSSWIRQYTANANNFNRIFFLKNKVNGEYWGWTMKVDLLWKTTNSGVNWVRLNDIGGCNSSDGFDIYFKDTSNGIITRGYQCFSTTTNGGYNWIHHPYIWGNSSIGIGDTNILWLTMGDSVIKTINFFQTYGKQGIPVITNKIFAFDTSIAYAGTNMTNMAKTTNGGGPIIYLGIDSQSVSIPVYFSLYQNYPNPFNPSTTIKFFIRSKSYVTLSIFDITGKEVLKVFDNNFLSFGTYKSVLDFGKLNLSSGVYYYRLSVVSPNSNSLFTETKKMVMIK
jgi:photosystem II stability/assembly factor-like uncharacterized protein